MDELTAQDLSSVGWQRELSVSHSRIGAYWNPLGDWRRRWRRTVRTDAAGAIASHSTVDRGTLEADDSYHFFQSLGDLLMTGATGTNVDVGLLLVAE